MVYIRPKTPMTIEELLFYATCIRANKSKYNYGRQANRTLKDLALPSRTEVPNWVSGALNRIADSITGSAQQNAELNP